MNKVIGVCLTLTHAEISREFLSALHNQAKEYDYKLLCFNSNIDFKYTKSAGAEAVYDMIPYELLDALVILHGTIHDDRILNGIINKAQSMSVPVIMAREERADIYSVSGKYDNAFRELVTHVVRDHGVKDVFYISGRRYLEDNLNTDSAKRYFILREALNECGIELKEENIECGEYWEIPTIEIINKLVKTRDKLPDAIFCANDVMALATCNRLKELGYRVPEDVIVTGFDGLECARFADPVLATCYEDIDRMAELIISMIMEIEENDLPISHWYYEYLPIRAHSCGCKQESVHFAGDPKTLFRNFRIQGNDEENADRWLQDLFTINTREYFRDSVSRYLNMNTAMLMRMDEAYLQNEVMGEKPIELPDTLKVLANERDSYFGTFVNRANFMATLIASMDSEGIYIISSVYIKNLILGLYLEKIKDASVQGITYNRHVRFINKGLLACHTQERHNRLKETVEKNRYKDMVTGLDNMPGLRRWFDDFTSRPENHRHFDEFCIFSFINYESILNEFGQEECDEVIKFIAQKIVEVHPNDSYVARVSDTDFAVILFAMEPQDRHNKIYEAVGKFYEAIANRNEYNPQGPQIEVSSGSIDLNPGWNETLNVCIKSGLAELYKNRMALYDGQKEGANLNTQSERDAINLLNLILKDNRFTYHFQPIVDAHTGDIIAYEALMRVTGGIRMNPLEILSIAKRHRLLYAIERATMFNVLEYISQNESKFGNKKIYINTIPGYFLKDYDLQTFNDKYGKYFDRCVIEITEDNTITEDELDRIKKAGGDEEVLKIAVDDYGTGHSNIMNLMQYKPHVVKIDRFLITDLHLDKNKQMFVKNIINFSRLNNIKALAEGVETKEELQAAIQLGVDYIQGYYTAKPQAEILSELPPEIKKSVIEANE